MRCLYCGKELALFKRLRGGEFCSDTHRQRYQEEYTQLALNRLLQANTSSDKEAAAPKAPEPDTRPAEPVLPSPALKRREKLGQPEAPAALPLVAAQRAESRMESAIQLGPASQASERIQTPQQTAVLEPEPVRAATPPVVVDPPPPVEEPAPASMSSFLVEFPVAAAMEAAAIPDTATNLERTGGLALPRLQWFPQEAEADRLNPAGPITLAVCTIADFQTPPRERGLELREFVRGVPQVEIHVRPASKSGFEPAREAFEVRLDARPPGDEPRLWQVPAEELPALIPKAEILMGELARLDFPAAGWEESANSDPSAEQPPVTEIPAAIGNARLEPMRVEPIQLSPAPRENSRPEPLRFEPVHIDPVFMEQIAGTAEFHALKNEAALRKTSVVVVVAPDPEASKSAVAEPARPEPVVPEPAVPETAVAEPAAPEPAVSEVEAAPTPEPPVKAAPAPGSINRPVPVTLHGLAPARGKPVQVYTSAASRGGDVQVPRDTGLPLRPTMVWGPAPKLPEAPAPVPAADEKVTASKPVRTIPVPEKREPRPVEIKPRRTEVRILPVQVKEETLPRLKEPVRAAETAKPEQVKEPAAAALKEPASKEVVSKVAPVESKPAAAAPAPLPSAPLPEPAPQPRPTPPARPMPEPKPAPPEEPDLLGLPKLSFHHSENFWTRLPFLVRIGAIALVLALAVGGVILTSRGSGAPKPPVPPVNTEPQVVEAGSALATTAGWVQDWFSDRSGSRQGRHVDVLRGTLTSRDYRMQFEGQIEQGALGWVFRANDKSFYVEKIQVITPGLEPVVALVHFAVINGLEQLRTQIPLAIKAHLDTVYKVRMDVIGNRFTAWVQDQKVDQWTDSRIDAGGVGLYYDSGDSAKLRDTLNVIPLKPK